MIACIDCAHADMRGTRREMVQLGFVNCAKKDKWHFEGLPRLHECVTFAPAEPEKVAARREWLESRRAQP